MAKKPAAKKPPPGLPAAIDSLITTFTKAGVKSLDNDDGEALRRRLTTLPYAATYFYPCPRFDHTDPDPLNPDTAFDVYFEVDWVNINYNVAVTDLTTGESYGPWGLFVPFGMPNPVAITVPARAIPFDPPPPAGAMPQPIVVADHDYALNVYASWGGLALGCISTTLVTLCGDPLTDAVFKALSIQGGLPFGTVPEVLLKQNAPKPAPKAVKKK